MLPFPRFQPFSKEAVFESKSKFKMEFYRSVIWPERTVPGLK
jgi:hypothetical protein